MAFAAMTVASLLAFVLMVVSRRVVRWSPGEREAGP